MKPFRLFLLNILFVIIYLNAAAQSFSAKPNVTTCPISNGYYEYLPQGYYNNANEKFPLLIYIHGMGELGNGSSDLNKVLISGTPFQINNGQFPASFNVNGQSFKFIVIAPQFTNNPWIGHVNTFIDYIVSHYKVDVNRIYLSGFSMGGGTCWAYAGENLSYGSRIAAIVPTAGAWQPSLAICQNMAALNLPILAFHNSGDNIVSSSWTHFFVDNTNNAATPPTPRAQKIIYNSNAHYVSQAFDLNLNNNGQYNFPGKNIYEWMLNFKRSTNVVPVQLLGFNATKQQNKSLLQWQTANELNSQGFEIQRSANASNWTAIGFVNSAGATAGNYSFTDIAPLHKINYYRLKQVDINGSFTNSEIKFLDFSRNSRFLFYPNPVVNEIKIASELDFKNVPFRIYTASGQLALQTKLNASGVATIPVAQLPKGSYVAEIIVNNIPEKIKFIKE